MSMLRNRPLIVRVLRLGAMAVLALPVVYLLSLIALAASFGGPGRIGPIEGVVGFAVPFVMATLGAAVLAALLAAVALLLEDGADGDPTG